MALSRCKSWAGCRDLVVDWTLVDSMFAVSANFSGASRGQVPGSNAPSKEIPSHHNSGAQQVGTGPVVGGGD